MMPDRIGENMLDEIRKVSTKACFIKTFESGVDVNAEMVFKTKTS